MKILFFDFSLGTSGVHCFTSSLSTHVSAYCIQAPRRRQGDQDESSSLKERQVQWRGDSGNPVRRKPRKVCEAPTNYAGDTWRGRTPGRLFQKFETSEPDNLLFHLSSLYPISRERAIRVGLIEQLCLATSKMPQTGTICTFPRCQSPL